MDLIDWQAFHFLRPLALIGLAPALVLAAWHGLRHLGRGAFDFLLSKELQAVLLSGGETSRRWRTPAMIALGLGLGCIAIAGPTWQRQDMPAREMEDALVVLFDLSLSMYAEDVQPSRLERARLELTDLLRLREEGTTALVAYAGDAHVVTPLTDDVETILHLSVSLSPDIMPVFGSRTGRAINLANQLLLQASQETGRLLLISDGIRGLKSASDACDSRFPLSILGVGTPAGAPIPVPVAQDETILLTDDANTPVIARLEEDRLRELAGLCGGSYLRARLGDEDIAALLPDWLEIGTQFAETEDERQVDLWVDMAYLFALPLVPLLLYAFRRGALPVMLLFLLIPPETSASWWDDLWQRRDQQGYQSLRKGDASEAAQLFADERWRGVSNFRDRSYEEAVTAFSGIEGKTADDHYNLGNGLAHQGRIKEAIQAFDQALAIEPDHEDAAFNKQLLESLQANRQQPQQGEKQESDADSQDGQSSEGNQAPTERDRTDQSAEQAPENDSPSEESTEYGEQPESQGQSYGDEQDERRENQASQAPKESEPTAQPPLDDDSEAQTARQRELIESLLRRVPDDPGGLLRQKFLYETRQRQESGQSRSDSGEIW